MNLDEIKTQELLEELNKREVSKVDEILMSYRNGNSLKNIKQKFGSYGIEIIIKNLNINQISIPKELWELFLS